MIVTRYRFRPPRVATITMLVIVVVTVSLGNWQTRRVGEKMALQLRLERMAAAPAVTIPGTPLPSADWAQRHVLTRGEFVDSGLVLVDNRVRDGVPGYHVVMPLRIEGGQMHVLVNRGWVAAGLRRDQLPHIRTPSGPQTVEGIAVIPPSNPYELSPAAVADAASGPVRQHVIIARVAAEQRRALQPLVILQTNAVADGLLRDWPRPDARANVNRAYALQWYAMAVLAFVLWVVWNLKKIDVIAP